MSGGSETMDIRKMTIEEFMKKVASKEHVPGGGAVGAIAAALGSGLTEMVANLTIGKKKYQEWEAEMERVIESMEALREEICDLAVRDMKAFDSFMEAMKLPKSTEEEKKIREQKMQEAIKEAIDVPYELARKVRDVIKETEVVTEFGNKNAVSDALSAAELLRAAFEMAKANVRINLKYLKDEKLKEYYTQEMDELEKQVYGSYNRIREMIEKNGWL
jgi:formiminotetrahydrofolate cyclodeaminase